MSGFDFTGNLLGLREVSLRGLIHSEQIESDHLPICRQNVFISALGVRRLSCFYSRLLFLFHWTDAFVKPCCSFRYGWSILILHGEALYWANLHTKIAGAAFEAIDLPFPAVLGDLDGISRAAPAAHSAENTLIDINFNSAPGNRSKTPLLFRVHERCGSAEQVLGHGFGHCKQSHFLGLLPLCTADARVEGQDDIRDIRNLRSFQDFDHCRDIAEGGHSHPEPLKKF